MADKSFGLTPDLAEEILDASRFVGRAPAQTEEYVAHIRTAILDRWKDRLGMQAELNV